MRRYRMFGKQEGFKSLNRYRLNKHYTKTLFKRKPWLRSINRIALTQKLADYSSPQTLKVRYAAPAEVLKGIAKAISFK